MDARYHRRSATDRMYLMSEDAGAPMYVGALLVLEGPPLLDATGHLRLAELRLRLGRRVQRAPSLRKVLYRPGLFQDPPLWVDDAAFSWSATSLCAEVAAPGGEAQFLRLARPGSQARTDRGADTRD